jgi:DNA-binding NtrC family response regulator
MDPVLQKQRVEYLEGSGFTLLSAKTQEEGLTIFRREKPDLILSPAEFDALELIHQESPQTPVIIITDHTALDDAVHALRLGAWDYILEPIMDFSLLERSIRKALERFHLIVENNAYRKALERDQKAGRQLQLQLLPTPDYFINGY